VNIQIRASGQKNIFKKRLLLSDFLSQPIFVQHKGFGKFVIFQSLCVSEYFSRLINTTHRQVLFKNAWFVGCKKYRRKSGENLKRGYTYTDNCSDDSKPLKFGDFVFQENNSQCYGHY
jgi:hypothetical protein